MHNKPHDHALGFVVTFFQLLYPVDIPAGAAIQAKRRPGESKPGMTKGRERAGRSSTINHALADHSYAFSLPPRRR